MLKPRDEVVVHMFMFSLSHVGRCGFFAVHHADLTVRINYLGNRNSGNTFVSNQEIRIMTTKFIYLQFAALLFACGAAYGETNFCLQDTTTLKSIRLSEVEVSGRVNPLKIAPGKLTYQVTKGSAGSSGSALELLRRMPGVSILANGTISLNGQAGIQLLVDGKTNFMNGENLLNFLASMPASSLDVVELITQPDATLDANGEARFINLKQAIRKANGLTVSVASNAEQGKYSRTYQNIAVTANTSKWTTSHTYSYGEGTELIAVNSTRYISRGTDMGSDTLRLDMDAVRKRKYHNHYYNGTLDYAPNDNVKIGGYVLINNHERTKQEAVRSHFFLQLFTARFQHSNREYLKAYF